MAISSPRRDITQRDLASTMGPIADAAAVRDAERDARDLKTDFNALMGRYEKQLYNVIFHLINDPDEAFDLTQETFISAYRAAANFRGEAKVSTWLYRIAVNHCKNRLKQRGRHRDFEGPSLDEGHGSVDDDGVSEARAIPDWSMAPEAILEQKELRAQIHKAVEVLPSDYRTVLILREVEDLSYTEIAEVLGLSMEAVKTRLSRARGMVRRRIEPYYRL